MLQFVYGYIYKNVLRPNSNSFLFEFFFRMKCLYIILRVMRL